jgi:hypothetical protein
MIAIAIPGSRRPHADRSRDLAMMCAWSDHHCSSPTMVIQLDADERRA